MFYSHEVLTSRKYGVATVWLVATLGSKSTLKRVSRKAILDVNVVKTCETIVTPEAPLALRLQSNLLYGVTRVYSQQCGYVLNDAEAAKNNLRALFSVVRTAALEPEGANKGRAEQLILQDDPSFILDLDLASEVAVGVGLVTTGNEDSQFSTFSPYSPQSTASRGSRDALILPPSVSSSASRGIGGLDLFGGRTSSQFGPGAESARLLDDEDLGLDLGLDDHTDLHALATVSREARAPAAPTERLMSEASQRAEDHFDEVVMPNGDDLDQLGHPPVVDPSYHNSTQDEAPATPNADNVQTSMRRRRRQAVRIIPLDDATELHNTDMSHWQSEYLQNMQEASRHRDAVMLANAAKKNAEIWVLGSVEDMYGHHPLSIFTGSKIIEAFTGIDLRQAGQKRSRESDDTDGPSRRVRPRSEPASEELGRGFASDDDLPMHDDVTIEVGRDAPTPMDDRRASSMLPWNQSAGSRRPTDQRPTSASGSLPFGSALSRRGSRLVSASPLMARGSAPRSDFGDALFPAPDTLHSDMFDEDFELFGPAAQVDTQTADESQWQRSTLIGESANFLSFVQTAIEDADHAHAPAVHDDEFREARTDKIDFDILLPPSTNSRVVAAQGFLHVLALASRNLLQVRQDEHLGPIELRVIAA